MDFVADATNAVERKGAVYPFVRASTIGYGYGHKRNDDVPDGVCAQLYEDCGGWWSHLSKTNEYEGGGLSRRVSSPEFQRYRQHQIDNIVKY